MPDPAPTHPDLETLRPLAQQFWDDELDDGAALRDALCTSFCTLASASVPVERALARINRVLDRVSREIPFGRTHPRVEPLRRLVMACCLECYYPSEPAAESRTVPV